MFHYTMMGIICFSGHMLLNLSRGKQDFLKEVVESFANKSGQSALCDALFSSQSSKERSFLGNDDIGNLDGQVPDLMTWLDMILVSCIFQRNILHHNLFLPGRRNSHNIFWILSRFSLHKIDVQV